MAPLSQAQGQALDRALAKALALGLSLTVAGWDLLGPWPPGGLVTHEQRSKRTCEFAGHEKSLKPPGNKKAGHPPGCAPKACSDPPDPEHQLHLGLAAPSGPSLVVQQRLPAKAPLLQAGATGPSDKPSGTASS